METMIDAIDAMDAVRRDGRALEYVPDDLITAELCLAAVQEEGRALRYVPDDLRTSEVCLAAVQEDGRALYDVPDDLRTAEICRAAMQSVGWPLELDDVPAPLITIGMIADNNDPRRVIEVYGGLVLTRADAEAADVCKSGLEEWIAEHCGGRDTITVADALETGDQQMYVCRVIAEAIRRAEG